MSSDGTARQARTDEPSGSQREAWPEGNPMVWVARAAHQYIPKLCELRWGGALICADTTAMRHICRGLFAAAAEAQFGADLRRVLGEEPFHEISIAMNDLRMSEGRLLHGSGVLHVHPGFDAVTDQPMVMLQHAGLSGFLTCEGARSMGEQWQALALVVDIIAAGPDPEELARLLPDPDEELAVFRREEDQRLMRLGAHHLRTPIF